jgi:hypothetical protein
MVSIHSNRCRTVPDGPECKTGQLNANKYFHGSHEELGDSRVPDPFGAHNFMIGMDIVSHVPGFPAENDSDAH